MKIIQNMIQNTKDITKLKDIKYLSFFLVCTIAAIFVSLILFSDFDVVYLNLFYLNY